MIFKATPSGFHITDRDGSFCKSFSCALGKSGLVQDKREGDHASPIGVWKILRVMYRADKGRKPDCHFPITEISVEDGWCDDMSHENYNQQVKLPFSASHELLWRDDDVYDIIVVLDHNTNPATPGEGSAIFMHIARPDYSGTEGCVALKRDDLEFVLSLAKPGDAIEICNA